MLHLTYPVIVEGKYDRAKLQQVISANIITTDGFGIFNKGEKLALLRALAKKSPLIVLTDSDGAGKVIRGYISSALPPESLIHLYTPELFGVKKRNNQSAQAGILGVEGMETGRLEKIFAPFAVKPDVSPPEPPARKITKADFYAHGLSGGEGSAALRDRLAAKFELPPGMTANALLAALNFVCTYEGYVAAAEM